MSRTVTGNSHSSPAVSSKSYRVHFIILLCEANVYGMTFRSERSLNNCTLLMTESNQMSCTPQRKEKLVEISNVIVLHHRH